MVIKSIYIITKTPNRELLDVTLYSAIRELIALDS